MKKELKEEDKIEEANSEEESDEGSEEVEENSDEEDSDEKKAEREEKKKKERNIEGVVNIYTSFNNTIVHVTDMSGRTITKVSGGMVTKHSRLKANPTIAMFISKRIAENMKESGIKLLYVRIRAKTGNPTPGPGANAIIKSLSREGFKILNILDVTRVPRGGPKKKGGRRGRRV
jgi:small subunit ribosomal protein S11